MVATRHPPLRPIWMERNPGFVESLDAILGRPFPAWAQLVREAEALQTQIAEGGIRWPSSTIEDIHRRSLNKFGDLRTVPPEFRMGNVLHFAELPSVRDYLDRATDLFLKTPGPFRYRDVEAELRRPLLYEIFTRLQWTRYGKRVYVVDPGTYELLVHTDLPAIPSSFLRVPLPAFYLKLPEQAFCWRDPALGEILEAEGIVVVFDRPSGDDGWGRGMTLLLAGNSPSGKKDSFLYGYSFFSPDTPINGISIPGFETVVRGPGARELVHDLPHAIFAFCLYLMSEHPQLQPVPSVRRDISGIRNPTKRRKLEQRNERFSALSYVYVGGRGLATQSPSQAGSGRKLTRPVWVRGHFRNQPFGPKRSQVKLIWIRPYVRGPDFAETIETSAQRVQPAERRER